MIIVIIAVLAASCMGHTVIQYPLPRYGGSDQLKQYPCGSNGQYNNFSPAVPLTILNPGLQPFQFQETVSHLGAPFRIALSVYGDNLYDNYVLADHIPHAVGGVPGDFYVANVIIPDVNCTVAMRCAIQVTQIMTDKFGTHNCSNPVTSTMCGFVGGSYFSCANVVINGTGDFNQLAAFYSTWDGKRTATFPSQLQPYLPGENAVYSKNAAGMWDVATLQAASPTSGAPTNNNGLDMLGVVLLAATGGTILFATVLLTAIILHRRSALQDDDAV